RSSATIEDRPEASCAGQHETVLNVRERDALLRALRTCWASLFSDRALAYRAHNRLADARVGMAVLVQRLVAADAAGVLFTANPLAAQADEMLIEASYGLGELLVSGRITPDRFILRREPLRVAQRTLSRKTSALIVDERGELCERPVVAACAELAALSDQAAERLARLGLAAERQFGGAQD